ncbi:alkyl hydroperoxide reductase subunit F [Alicyclobacillus acidocaldarius]|uniref:Alkyl hydroperoxide reductase, F subunit n=1 Tax=Alicyclobacillus acidocaldarius subsp. acidocaldarius (strain ATCC 27009 / DSM 446 / BCRC 14685 / JCM 5260 / KCTC 1825 / NBRC 15652 / NCIMB 11725 / NRRL B-14509 / 104-IA) TaxID=521098 RepID=C8WT08_ALIAD|nr:alkyl hydroperoxide reductase subunit F [Alicyclobacillus acidocaldarius]ACV59523.1 alkyl hydroperoxide reductase, F subunit [Alicyclobacillus acidocaldarius subsp. acidocaldarius DSM 446]
MVLDDEIREQLKQYLELMEGDVVIRVAPGSDDASRDMMELVNELKSMSPKIHVEEADLPRRPSFSVNRPGEDTGIVFAGAPLGHEFTSLVLALLQVSGRPPKVDESVIRKIQSLEGTYEFETYVSLSCHNCPDVVQALNLMSVLNPNIRHTMIDGAVFKSEVEEKNVMAVPTVYLNGEFFESGRMSVEEILAKLGSQADVSELNARDPYDVLVIGGGPAGASAAIYAARKGIRTGIVVDRFGGQVNDTLGIENFISVKYTEGPKFAAQLEEHVRHYNIDIIKSQRAKQLRKGDLIEVDLESGATLKSKTVIIATGARWRNLGVPGEKELQTKGVAYCPHCDGPLFQGKRVAVIGGGNSGIEAAIDLAGLASHVTVLEFLPQLKADEILQKRLFSLPNVTVLTNVETKEILGTERVTGIRYADRATGEEHQLELEGVFVQIGLVPNTEWLGDFVEKTRFGEIVVDSRGQTSVEGVFAAGDCTNVPYKQIIISMGSGATAALGAFDYLIRH